MDRLVRLAAAAPGERPPETVQGGEVTAVANLTIRGGAPDTQAPTVRTVQAGTLLRFVAWTEGQSVGGNPYWYRDPEGNFFWAGGTSKPNPSE